MFRLSLHGSYANDPGRPLRSPSPTPWKLTLCLREVVDFPNYPSPVKYIFDLQMSVCFDPTIQDPSQDVEMEVEQPVITEGFSTNKLVQFNIEDIDR